MKTVVIGASGHIEYALNSKNANSICAFAKGSADEDMSRLSHLNLKSYANYKQMLVNEQPDIAVVNPHYYLNEEVIITCLENNINCFVEKPISFTQRGVERIKRAKLNSTAFLATMMIHRFEPWFVKAIEYYKNGEIGSLVKAHAQKSYKMGVKPRWMQDVKKFGGIIPWVGAHAIDWLLWLNLDTPKLKFAHKSIVGNKNNQGVETNATMVFALGQAMATVSLDYLRPENATEHGDDQLKLVGDKGIIEVKNKSVSVQNETTKWVKNFEPEINIFDEFVMAVQLQKDFRINESDIFELAKLTAQANDMAKNNN